MDVFSDECDWCLEALSVNHEMVTGTELPIYALIYTFDGRVDPK